MRHYCRQKFLKHLKEIKQQKVNQKCKDVVLILDEKTTKIMGSILDLNSLLETLNIGAMTKCSLNKKPMPQAIAIYYISKESVPQLFKDFKPNPLFFSANILLCEQITPQVMNLIAQQQKLLERLATLAQLHLNVRYPDQNVGLIDQEGLMKQVLRSGTGKQKIVAQKMFQAIICGFGQNISVNVSCQQSSKYCRTVAKMISDEIQSFKKTQKQNAPKQEEDYGLKKVEPQIIKVNLIVVDRKLDLVTPIIRSFYYFPMLTDLFKLNYKNLSFKLKESDVSLNIEDKIFKKYKNMHLAKALSIVNKDFVKFKDQNKAAQLQQGNFKQKNIQLKDVIKELPEYTRNVSSFKQHINIMDEMSIKSKQDNLTELGELEMLIISNLTSKGESEKDKKIVQKAIDICNKYKNPQILARILFIMLLSLEVSQSQKKSFIKKLRELEGYGQLAEIMEKQLKNLIDKPVKLKINEKRKQDLFLDRHQALIYSILNDLIDTGSSKLIKTVRIDEQTQSAPKRLLKVSQKRETQWVVLMLGGISMNEICMLQRIGQEKKGHQVSMISECVLQGWSYLDVLMNIYRN